MWLATTLTSRSSGRGRPVRPIPTSPFSASARKRAGGREEEGGGGEPLAEEKSGARPLAPPQRQDPRPRLVRVVLEHPRVALDGAASRQAAARHRVGDRHADLTVPLDVLDLSGEQDAGGDVYPLTVPEGEERGRHG